MSSISTDNEAQFASGEPNKPLSISEWGQSEVTRVASGWGQPSPMEADTQGARSSPAWRSSSSTSQSGPRSSLSENYDGPIETWYNFKQVSKQDWDLFKAHQIVYTDGKNVVDMEPGWFFCAMCHKKTPTGDLMLSHLESAKHRRNYEWLQDRNCSSATPAESSTKQNPDDSWHVRGYPPLTSEDKDLVARHRGEVDGYGWIICTICGKKLMDMSFFKEHISSRKHMNNLEWTDANEGFTSLSGYSDLPPEISVREWGFYCNLCDASLTSKTIISLHVESARHRKKLNAFETYTPDLNAFDMAPRRGPTYGELIELSSPKSRAPSPPRSAPLTRPTRASPQTMCPRLDEIPDLIDIYLHWGGIYSHEKE